MVSDCLVANPVINPINRKQHKLMDAHFGIAGFPGGSPMNCLETIVNGIVNWYSYLFEKHLLI